MSYASHWFLANYHEIVMFSVHLYRSIAFVSIDIDFRVKKRIQLRIEIKLGQLDILRDCLIWLPTSKSNYIKNILNDICAKYETFILHGRKFRKREICKEKYRINWSYNINWTLQTRSCLSFILNFDPQVDVCRLYARY